MPKAKNHKKQTAIKFSKYNMDTIWQHVGRISSENLRTFLAATTAKIKLSHMKNKTQYEYVFRKDSQISIQNHDMIFRNGDIEKLSIQSIWILT